MSALLAPAAAAIANLATIGLDELVDEAELLTRIDRKYAVPAALLPVLLADLPAGSRVLAIEGRRHFGYTSTYLDTPGLTGFLDAGRSRRRRWKVRTRRYTDTGASFLEVKTRGARGTTVKERIPHPEAEARGLTGAGRAFVAAGIGSELVLLLRPTLVTSYRRTTFQLPDPTPSRVTVDTDLGFRRAGTCRELRRPDLVVVETKGGSRASAADRLLWRHGHRPVSLSKYGVGMAALHPELPRLKWHRVLDQHLAVPRGHAVPEGIS